MALEDVENGEVLSLLLNALYALGWVQAVTRLFRPLAPLAMTVSFPAAVSTVRILSLSLVSVLRRTMTQLSTHIRQVPCPP